MGLFIIKAIKTVSVNGGSPKSVGCHVFENVGGRHGIIGLTAGEAGHPSTRRELIMKRISLGFEIVGSQKLRV